MTVQELTNTQSRKRRAEALKKESHMIQASM